MTLAEISQAHRNALAVAKGGVTVYQVEHEDIYEFGVARRVLQHSVENLHAAEPLKTFASICSQLHARVCRTPCPPTFLFETFEPQLRELQPKLKPILAAADERLRAEFKCVCDRLAIIQKLRDNPLAAEVRAMLDLSDEASERVVVVIRQPALWPSVRSALDPEGRRKRMTVMKPSELRRTPPADRLILFGPPWLFEYREELYLFRSPVASNVELFAFRHDCSGQVSASALEVQPIVFKGMEKRPITPEHLQSEPLFMFKPRSFVPRSFLGLAIEAGDDHAVQVEAWPIHLGRNRGTYLDPDGSIFTLECTHEGERAVCTGVERRGVEELETGDLVVLTTEGGGDLIRPLADEILGELAQTYRLRQNEWKRKLRERVYTYGLTSVVTQLQKLGSRLAKEPNVRTWLSDRNIGPNNLTDDFNAILALTGLASSASSYIDAISGIRSAHQAAGFKLQGRLLNDLKGKDVRQAFVGGSLEVRTKEGGPAKTIFLVEHITRETVSVPNHAIARVFELEGLQ